MALTPTEALALQQEHRLTLRFADDGWYAETRKHTRLHRVGFQTQEEAIEAAIVTINSTVVRDQEADGRRLFDLLKSGRYFVKPRRVNVEGGTTLLWDVRNSETNAIIVQGERSLRAAILEAERVLGA